MERDSGAFYDLDDFKVMMEMRRAVSQVYQKEINITYMGMGDFLILFFSCFPYI